MGHETMECYRHVFPLKCRDDVCRLFASELEKSEPNLLLLSLVVGAIEAGYCSSTTTHACKKFKVACNWDRVDDDPFPLEMSLVEIQYNRFLAELHNFVLPSRPLQNHEGYTMRSTIKMIADFVWKPLSNSFYKDKPHIQSIYSFMTLRLLDCFGLALTVVAACQQLGLYDVHLALSEDHAWIVFDQNGRETAEIAWIGKGNDKKRGQPIEKDAPDYNWLYLNGHPVICTRHMEAAAIATSMNPGINSKTDSEHHGQLQQALLWLFFDKQHIDRYPMAQGTLGDLEEIDATLGRPSAEVVFRLGIEASCLYYSNAHVYPHTFLGGYLFRQGRFKEAMQCWMDAAFVVSSYRYNKEDSEVYKEFYEIVHDFLPHIVKSPSGKELRTDTEFYAMILTFFDRICVWEMESQTPVVHSDWAKSILSVLTKFPSTVRQKAPDTQINVICIKSHGTASNVLPPWISLAAQKAIDCACHMSRVLCANHGHVCARRAALPELQYAKQQFEIRSKKLLGVSDMLTVAEKLNVAALQLQLTALSQTTDITVARSRKRRQNCL